MKFLWFVPWLPIGFYNSLIQALPSPSLVALVCRSLNCWMHQHWSEYRTKLSGSNLTSWWWTCRRRTLLVTMAVYRAYREKVFGTLSVSTECYSWAYLQAQKKATGQTRLPGATCARLLTPATPIAYGEPKPCSIILIDSRRTG
jgi:hypothetical protein